MGNSKKEITGSSLEPQSREDKRSPGGRLYDQARVLMASRNYREAADKFLESAKEEPHAKTYELLGECLMRQGNFAEAIPFLAAATTLNSGVRAPSLLAEAWFEMKRYSDALDAAKIALARDRKNKTALKIQSASQQIQNAAEE